jgi:hypothetical protein
MEIVEQFYSNGLTKPSKANKPICASSGKVNNTTDKAPARAKALMNTEIHTKQLREQL